MNKYIAQLRILEEESIQSLMAIPGEKTTPCPGSPSKTLLLSINNPQRLEEEIIEYLDPDCEFLREDIKFAVGLLRKRRKSAVNLLQEYKKRWLTAAQDENAPHKKHNTGRRIANAWLKDSCR